MTSYIRFLRSYPRHVGFGFFFAFFSSLGQTFLISLYVPSILHALDLSNTLFGTIYAVSTLCSSLLLMLLGGRIDTSPLAAYVYRSIAALAFASLLLGSVSNALVLPFALFAIRFSGQGLMSHISKTVMGRYFEEDRGKALSISALGYPLGEMIFPLLIAFLIPLLGWRTSLMLNALILLAMMLPLLHFMPIQELCTSNSNKKQQGKSSVQLREILTERRFWILAPSIVLLSLCVTAFFFYQIIFIEAQGWDKNWYAAAFSCYAASRFLFGLLGGPLVDRYSAKSLFPLMLLPLCLGLLLLGFYPSQATIYLFLILTGAGMGLSSPIKSSAVAELYGTASLGRVRGLFTSFMVFGTALGPMLFGFFLDQGYTFSQLFICAAGLLALTSINSLRIYLKR